jgi:hypothetical protein
MFIEFYRQTIQSCADKSTSTVILSGTEIGYCEAVGEYLQQIQVPPAKAVPGRK